MEQGAPQQHWTGKSGKLVLLTCRIAYFLLFVILCLCCYEFVFHIPVPKFSVSSAFVSRFNLSSTHHLTADLDIEFSVFNPSEGWTAKYGTLDVLIMDGSTSTLLVNTTFSPFSLVPRTKASIAVQCTYVKDDAASDGTIELGATFLSWVRFEVFGVKTRSYHMWVSCPYIPVGISSPQAEVPWECEVNL